jgi:hypothetical protein
MSQQWHSNQISNNSGLHVGSRRKIPDSSERKLESLFPFWPAEEK